MQTESKEHLIVWWVIWAALLNGVFVIYFVLGNTAERQPAMPESSIWLACLAPLLVSTMIRWGVLSRVQSAQAAFSLFVAGLALAESTGILGILLFPEHKQELFIFGVIGILQFAPFFARRYETSTT